MKQRFLLILLLMCGGILAYSQSYNQERTALANFLVRMYENAPFDGVKAVEDYDNAYLMSVVKLDKEKYKTESALNRVATVKAMSQASRFFNGSSITDDMIIRTTKSADGTSGTEITENIREHSVGYVKQLEHLTNFLSKDGQQVFIFITPLTK
ncbi:hypothetical protein [uncultured Muribaculum sp.]|uniref:hypothetical protein n=2 Tax=Bacteroidales TaxID=171549 RepID=UPI00266F5952|nr:hypothetical protein [uncultured Muribaculum sp.]